MKTKNDVDAAAAIFGVVFTLFSGIVVITMLIYSPISIKKQERIDKEISIELCGSVANTILIKNLPDKMPNVDYYAVCRVGDKVEIKTK